MKKHILFLGAPGAGKGTQAELLSQSNSYLHLSTGELLRKEIEMNTALGIQVKDIMNRGELVSDELVLKIVRQNLVKDNKGWILDGYPRNLSQANSLNEVLIEINQPLEIVFYLDIPEEVLIKRLLLRGRKDDSEEAIRTRVNIYKKTTKDLIAFTLVDPFTNFGNRIDANIGDMENKGIELTLNIPVMKTDDYENVLDFNIAFNDNVVTRLPDQQFVGGISGGVGNTIQTHVEGEAPFSFLVYQQVYDSDGRPIEGVYVDRNGDNIINDDDRYIKEDPFADIIMGLTNSIRYKDWDFSVTARASIGNYAYNNLASNAVFNAAASINNILNNIHSDYLSTGFMDFTENSLLSDHYIQEASFVKIDNISIGYNMTTNSGCKIRFFGSLQNVATFTDYEGIDPEIYGGIDNNFYPRPQTGVFGVTFEF